MSNHIIYSISLTSNMNPSNTTRSFITLNERPHHIHTTTATIGADRVITNEYNYLLINDENSSISNNQRAIDTNAEISCNNIKIDIK